ncbi:hypothetical protein QBC38DRAFT_500792 [Podospora fimiseda]|uniref:Uncharacterized protein n=1 Tax=Podospora fimiseda TaxID=252190 RepID=A0AAN7BM00_9PEZI|nr:hypothetical protein QBC38DRAFT_500792 [Podospora fimiseda]
MAAQGGNEGDLMEVDPDYSTFFGLQELMNSRTAPGSRYWLGNKEIYTVDYLDQSKAGSPTLLEFHKSVILLVPLGTGIIDESEMNKKIKKALDDAFILAEGDGVTGPCVFINDDFIRREDLFCFRDIPGNNSGVKHIMLPNPVAFKGLEILHQTILKGKSSLAMQRLHAEQARTDRNQVQNLVNDLLAKQTEQENRQQEQQQQQQQKQQQQKQQQQQIKRIEAYDSGANKWVDLRLRALHYLAIRGNEYADTLVTPSQDLEVAAQQIINSPSNIAYARGGAARFNERFNIIGASIHGGDLKNDCRIIVRGDINRRHDAKREAYFRVAFRNIYGEINPAVARDILEALDDASLDDETKEWVDSHRRFIDKYVAVRDLAYLRISQMQTGVAYQNTLAGITIKKSNRPFMKYMDEFAKVCDAVNKGELKYEEKASLDKRRKKLYDQIDRGWQAIKMAPPNWGSHKPTVWQDCQIFG